jgi:hypothetical protein
MTSKEQGVPPDSRYKRCPDIVGVSIGDARLKGDPPGRISVAGTRLATHFL